MRDLVLFVQFKTSEKHQWGSVTFGKVAGLSLEPYCFSCFLNCTNGIKSCKASHITTFFSNLLGGFCKACPTQHVMLRYSDLTKRTLPIKFFLTPGFNKPLEYLSCNLRTTDLGAYGLSQTKTLRLLLLFWPIGN